MFHKNEMGSIIRASGTIFNSDSLSYFNTWLGLNGLTDLYSVISVIAESLLTIPKRQMLRSWTTRVRFLASWSVHVCIVLPMYGVIDVY